jgi:hypothetical protein
MRRWQSLVKYLRLENPQLQYVAFKEHGGATGMRHLHILLYPWVWVDRDDLAARWQSRTGAWMINIQRITGTGAMAHAAKYAAKSEAFGRKAATYSSKFPKLRKLGSTPFNTIRSLGGPEGTPTHYTTTGWVVFKHDPACNCFQALLDWDTGAERWLKSSRGRSPPGSPGP